MRGVEYRTRNDKIGVVGLILPWRIKSICTKEKQIHLTAKLVAKVHVVGEKSNIGPNINSAK